MPTVPDRWLSTKEVAEYAQVSEATIYRAVALNRLQAGRTNGRGHLRFRQDAVDAWLESAGATTDPV